VEHVRTRLGIIAVTGLLFASILAPAAMGAQELELLAATDALQTAGRTTVESLFWRSGFGASVLGGPTIAGNTGAFAARASAIENYTNGTTPVGVRPIFIEFASLPSAQYAPGTVNASDYSTQRWNFTNASRVTGAATLGVGAAADAQFASYLLRTNHYANGTQNPAAPLLGANGADGVLGLWLVEALADRVAAITAHGAYNGSALGAFNFSDPALNDNDGSNGWQLVPDSLLVSLSSDPEPLFLGFAPDNNTSSVRGQALLILGLSSIVELSYPAGDHSWLFDSDPYDASLYNASLALLNTVVMNAQATHWDGAASTYTQAGGRVETGDLALLVKALSAAEHAADASMKPAFSAARERALAALTSLSDPFGVFAASYEVAGATVTPDFANVSLWSQSAALEAVSSVYATTGLKVHYDWMFKASAGLESALFYNGSYHAWVPEPALSTFTAGAVGETIAGLRDLALTHEEPLAIYRLLSATQWLFTAPPLTLSGASAPPVIGASFVWNATGATYVGATDFEAVGGLLASLEFLSTGPEFLAGVGGGVFVTERAALLLHNATATQMGASIDALDLQIAALQGQLATLQASFDALNANVTATTDRLNLSLENETISAARIVDLQANVTLLRTQLNQTVANLTQAQELLGNASGKYGDLQQRFNDTNINLTAALSNASGLDGRISIVQGDLDGALTAMNTTNATLATRTRDLGYAQQIVAIAVLGGMVAGAGALLFLQRFVLTPRVKGEKAEKPEAPKKPLKGKADKDEGDDDHDDLK
jgi:hypothetical protein